MSLKSYRAPKVPVPISNDQTLTVRGLSLADVMGLTEEHGRTLAGLYASLQDDAELALDDMGAMSQSLVTMAPDLAAAVIATAAGEPENAAVAAEIPFPAQVELLETIGRLTFSMSSPKKLLEIAVRVMQGTTGLMGDLRTSKAGSMGRAGK